MRVGVSDEGEEDNHLWQEVVLLCDVVEHLMCVNGSCNVTPKDLSIEAY